MARALAIANADDKVKALADAEMSADDLDTLMYEIALDPALSEAYAAGR